MKNPSKRLRLQIQHIQNMLKEQNRMVLAEVEPTESERKDMLDLLDEIKTNAEAEGQSVIKNIKPTYAKICTSLSELGYNVSPYSLLEAEAPPAVDESSKEQAYKTKKQVHFENEPNNSLNASNTPIARLTSATPAFTQYRDDISSDDPATYQYQAESYQDEPTATSRQIYEENNLVMEDQDRRLDRISESVGRQRAMGEDINTELGVQNDILGDVEAQIDRSQVRLDNLTNGVKTFNRKSRECGVCSIIMVLILILLILIII